MVSFLPFYFAFLHPSIFVILSKHLDHQHAEKRVVEWQPKLEVHSGKGPHSMLRWRPGPEAGAECHPSAALAGASLPGPALSDLGSLWSSDFRL